MADDPDPLPNAPAPDKPRKIGGGWSLQQIADARKVSVRTVQREIDRAIAERRLDAPDRFVRSKSYAAPRRSA